MIGFKFGALRKSGPKLFLVPALSLVVIGRFLDSRLVSHPSLPLAIAATIALYSAFACILCFEVKYRELLRRWFPAIIALLLVIGLNLVLIGACLNLLPPLANNGYMPLRDDLLPLPSQPFYIPASGAHLVFLADIHTDGQSLGDIVLRAGKWVGGIGLVLFLAMWLIPFPKASKGGKVTNTRH